jgi:SAM-dependent methyltransferase/uncharacterized protein YbaR (Trm112 family)
MTSLAQSDEQMRGEASFRRFHAAGVNDGTLAYMQLAVRERRGLFRDLALRGVAVSPFLELGAETGAISLLLANDLAAAGLALDLSRDALAAMPAYAARLALPNLPHRAWGDAHGLPLRNNALPFAVAWGALHHFPDPRPVLAELRRVLAPGGMLLVGDEPVRRLLALHLSRTRTLHSLPAWTRALLHLHLLPWFVDVDGREAVEAGAQYKRWLAGAFERVEMSDHPYVTAMIRAAGPLARLLLWPLGRTRATKAEVMLFGGAIGARCRKDPETGGVWLAEGGQRPMHEAPAAGMRCLLLRKRAGLDRLRVYFETKPDRLTVLIDDLPIAARPFAPDALDFALPADALQRSTIRLVLNSTDEIRPAHFVFADAAGRNSFWIDCAAPPSPAPDIERALACPACWTVTARCRADLCGQPCLEKARDSLAVQQNRMTVRANAGVDPAAVAVCPVNAIDRPPLSCTADDEWSCPQCGQKYATTDGIMNLLTPRARKALS